jgi:CMP-N,N'-diacetyllegionaminic acid synthase
VKTVALIPARAGSKGVAHKNIKMLGSKPLIAYTIEAARKTTGIDSVYVTTESQDIAQIAQQHGADILFRPEELALDSVQTDEVFLYALRQLQYRGVEPDALVLLQPTSPFRGWRDIERALELYYEMEGDFTILSGYRDKGYHWTVDEDDDFVPVMHNPMHRLGRQSYNDNDWLIKESGSIYVVNSQRFSEQRCYRIPPFHFYLMSEEESLDIDTPEQFEIAVRMIESMK